jgi:hypothetical protein
LTNFLPFSPYFNIKDSFFNNFSIAFESDLEFFLGISIPLKLFLHTSLQPGTSVATKGNLQLAASNNDLGNPSL